MITRRSMFFGGLSALLTDENPVVRYAMCWDVEGRPLVYAVHANGAWRPYES